MGQVILILAIFLPIAAFPFDPQSSPAVTTSRDSRFCLGCHDGTLAINIFVQDLSAASAGFLGETPKNFCLDRGHPVGMDYLLVQLRSRGRLRDPSSIDPAVKLENGLVSCKSCHDPNSQLRAKLVMSNGGSRLCFSCHNL